MPTRHARDRARADGFNPKTSRRIRTITLLVVGLVAVVLALSTISVLGDPARRSPLPSVDAPSPALSQTAGSPIDGISCDTGADIGYHVHAHLYIRLDGQVMPVPADVGRTLDCFYWLHTHTNDGILHVEAPHFGSYTLGQFFAVWGQPLGPNQIGTEPVAGGRSVYAFVDGKAWAAPLSGITLANLTVIEIQIGRSPMAPLPWVWSADYRASSGP